MRRFNNRLIWTSKLWSQGQRTPSDCHLLCVKLSQTLFMPFLFYTAETTDCFVIFIHRISHGRHEIHQTYIHRKNIGKKKKYKTTTLKWSGSYLLHYYYNYTKYNWASSMGIGWAGGQRDQSLMSRFCCIYCTAKSCQWRLRFVFAGWPFHEAATWNSGYTRRNGGLPHTYKLQLYFATSCSKGKQYIIVHAQIYGIK